jgi:transposase-like protein
MNTQPAINPYKRHRFPAEIISHSVWLYYRFSLSYRDVEELMVERGVPLSHEAVRYWCRKFGQAYANALRRRRPRPGDKWHLDEVFLTINPSCALQAVHTIGQDKQEDFQLKARGRDRMNRFGQHSLE